MEKYEFIEETNQLKYYNKKYKMWVILNFQEDSNLDVETEIIQTLRNQYMKQSIAN